MEPIEAIAPVSRIHEFAPIAPVEDIVTDTVEQPYATWASPPTTFEPYPALLDPAAASIAAAASAQHLKLFSMGLPRRRERS